jgi:hypothetical protein
MNFYPKFSTILYDSGLRCWDACTLVDELLQEELKRIGTRQHLLWKIAGLHRLTELHRFLKQGCYSTIYLKITKKMGVRRARNHLLLKYGSCVLFVCDHFKDKKSFHQEIDRFNQ